METVDQVTIGAPAGDASPRLSGTYQDLLRAVGAVLDRDRAGVITIVEVGDGFVIRRQIFRNTHVETAVTHLTFETLVQRLVLLRESRPHSAVLRGPCLWSGMAPSHQDFFRSFGFELDDAGARNVVIDELSETLFVAYERGGGTRAVTLDRSHLENLLNEAVRRRAQTDNAALSQRLGIATGSSSAPPLRDLSAWAPMQEGVEYSRVLRVLGTVLDQREVRDVGLLETPDGITARYRKSALGRMEWEHFPYADLERLGVRQDRKFRVVGLSRPGGHDRYRGLFQAVGHELERIFASGILLTEQQDSLELTFEYIDASRSTVSIKDHSSLDHDVQAEMRACLRTGRWPSTSLLLRCSQ